MPSQKLLLLTVVLLVSVEWSQGISLADMAQLNGAQQMLSRFKEFMCRSNADCTVIGQTCQTPRLNSSMQLPQMLLSNLRICACSNNGSLRNCSSEAPQAVNQNLCGDACKDTWACRNMTVQIGSGPVNNIQLCWPF